MREYQLTADSVNELPDEVYVFPASFAQRRLWFLDRLDPGIAHYTISKVLHLIGPLDVEALEKALHDIIHRHEVLRTHFEERDGEPVQVISQNALAALPLVDLTGLPEQPRESTVEGLLREELRQPFDLGRGPLMRAYLWKLAGQEHTLLISMHHIISDGWSMGILWRELSELYRAHLHAMPSQLPELPIQYADFATWQLDRLQGDTLDIQLNYWKGQLADLTTLDLPLDRPRPAVLGYAGAQHPVRLSSAVSAALKRMGQREGSTLFMTTLTLFQVLLSRFSGSQDIVVGTPIANRNQTEIELLIGFFVNTLVLRADLSGNPSFLEALKRVRDTCFDAYDHQNLPFERLVEELRPSRDLSRHPLFQVMFTLQNAPAGVLALEGLTVQAVEIPSGIAKFDLTLSLCDTPDGVSGYFEYNTDLFDASTIARMAESFTVLVESALAEPDQRIANLPLLTEAASHQLLVEWNATEADYPKDRCLHHLFEAQVMRTPDRVALIFNDQQLTYAELNAKANQLANYLQSLGVGPDVLVGLCLERSFEMVVALFGVLKAGGAYVPLDPQYPKERLAFMVEDAAVGILLTQKTCLPVLAAPQAHIVCLDSDWERIATKSELNLVSAATAENLAYVIYTSGSTGTPKGVMIPHQAICNHMNWMQTFFPLTEADRVLQKTPFSFDASIWEFYAPLLEGAGLIMAQPATNLDTEYLVKTIVDHQVTILQLVPSLLRMLLETKGIETCTSLRHLFCGGEALPFDLQGRFFAKMDVALINLYGPTEACIDATFWRCERGSTQRVVPIGGPISNTQIYVLDSHLNPLPIGVPGELHVGGSGLARGYLNQPELTAEKFIPDPFSSQPGARLYKTGDLACYLPDGSVKYLGRKDHQVKLRGFRIELGEIEAVLKKHHAVHEVVVLVREDNPVDKRLVAYIVLDPDRKSSISELRSFLKQKLPDYMVPAAFVFLDDLPLMPNGKLDRRLLPVPDTDRPQLGGDYVAPWTHVQELLAGIWCAVLGLERVGVHDDFFELGGHSLLATRVMSRVQALFGVDVPVRILFEQPSAAALAAHISKSATVDQTPPLLPVPREPHMQSSFAQRRLWFLDRLDPGIAHYTISKVLHLIGPLDVEALEKALHDIIHRHEVLRTHFEERDGEPVQVISQNALAALPLVDLTGLPEQPRESTVEGLLREELRQPFDLGRGPLMRAYLWKLAGQEHTLLISMHHIISDGWSMGILWRELSELYRAHLHAMPSQLPELPIQYADFATWQLDRLQGDTLDIQLNYWKGQLADLTTLDLPLDRPRPAVLGYAGAQHPVRLSSAVSAALKRMGQREGSTLFMTTLTLFQVLLSRFSGSQDIVVGTPIANRNQTEIELLIGFFVNTLVLRADLSGNPSFLEALKRVRDTCFDAYDHQNLPFERLVEELRPSRDLSRHPLFQVMFTLQNAPAGVLALEGLTVQAVEIPSGIAKFDLTLSLCDTPDGVSGYFEYNTDLFDASTIARMAESFTVLVESALAEPDQRIANLPLLTEAASHQLLVEWNATEADYPKDRCLHHLFEAQVMRTPDRVALIFNDQQLTYAELNAKANQLANYLQSLGVGPDVLVGLCLERSFEMVVALFGVLKAGGAYVPLDPQYPKERLAFMVEDTAVGILLTQKKLSAVFSRKKTHMVCLDSNWELMTAESNENPTCAATAENIAYVIYTSGSTGKPKGVMIQHQAICNYMHWMQTFFPLTETDRILQKTPFSFDVSIAEIYAPLLVGAQLVVAQPGTNQDTVYLVNTVADRKVTILQLVPSLLRILLQQKGIEACTSLRRVFCGGEALAFDLQELFFTKLNAELINMYGPTEACIDATFWKCDRASTKRIIPIGGPISNTQVYVLDSRLSPLPIGVPGELHIGGYGLARGYLNQPELTAKKFIPDPFSSQPDARLYKTGDLACYLPDGSVNYLGRKDHQVKVRGFRIELGEIEALLKKHHAVHEAVVLVREDNPDDKRLVAYIVFDPDRKLSISELRSFLKQKLPDYMVPAAFVFLDDLPLTPNDKVDRRRLPAPDTDRPQLGGDYVAPWTHVQELLAGIWCAVLGLERVGVQDDFFELGGHSLLATRVMSRVRAALGVDLPVRLLFEKPTVAELALHISGRSTDDQTPPLLPVPRKPYMPTSFAQRRLWFLDRFHPGLPLYNIHTAVRIDGVMDRGALACAFNEVVRRHESLHTTFQLVDGEPMQVIAAVKDAALSVVDLSELAESDRAEAVNRLMQEENIQPFDLSTGPLIRIKLLCQASDHHILLITMHHIVSDGWSVAVLFRELEGLYASSCSGQQRTLPDLPVQYADYAVWQHAWLQGEKIEKHLNYWKEQLRGAPPLLELPADRPHPATQRFRGDHHSVVLPAMLSKGLRDLSRQQGVTLFMTLLGAFQLLLHRYTSCEDILVGSPVAGRNHAEVENLIGFFVNTLVLRTDFTGDPTVSDLLGRIREVSLGAFEHQELPFDKLVEALNPERQESHHPLVQVMFAFQPTDPQSAEGSRWAVLQKSAAKGYAKFDLTLFMKDGTKGLNTTLEYSTDLFDRTTIERMMGHFQTLLEGFVSNPEQRISELPFLTEQEQHRMLVRWNHTATNFPKNLCVHQIFAMQAKQTPEAVALEFDGNRLSYAELDALTNQLANYLRINGVGPNVLVGICMERSWQMVVSMLAILKAGSAYVPLDPSYPEARLNFMITESNPPILLTQKKFVGKFHNKEVFCLDENWETVRSFGKECPDVSVGPNDLAYVMYTSGSTGQPKGVCVPHKAICRLVLNTNYITLTPSDRLAHASNTSFDAATFEIWGALMNGACLVGMTTFELLSPMFFGEHLRRKRITVLFLTTALFNQVAAEAPSTFSALDCLMFGGEAVDPKWVRTVIEKGAPKRLLHVYGPTENTTFSTWYHVKHVAENMLTIPIGQPISNSQCYILDKNLNSVPVGVPGVLFLGGDGLARGYHNQPEMTSEKFISNPFNNENGQTLYNTGDIAVYLPDGDIEFIGRADSQIKLRGFRIELREIESVLNSYSGVYEAVALIKEDQPGARRIVAYVILNPAEKTDNEKLRNYVRAKLPEYMVPSDFVVLDSLPLTPNGKVDRKALPAPDLSPAKSNQSFLAPRDALELYLAKIWEKLLHTMPVGIRDNFFDLGGHSLLAIQVISQIKKYTGKEIAVPDLFKHPTIEQLAQIIQSKGWSSPYSFLIPFQPLGPKPPFFCIHGSVAEAANLVGLEQPFYGAMPHGFNGKKIPSTVAKMAANLIKEIKTIQPQGPYFIGGYSFGGMLAFEIARLFQEQGEEIGLLLLLDPSTNEKRVFPSQKKERSSVTNTEVVSFSSQREDIKNEVSAHLFQDKVGQAVKSFMKRLVPNLLIKREILNQFCSAIVRIGLTVPPKWRKVHALWTYQKVIKHFTPGLYIGKAVLIRTSAGTHAPDQFWGKYISEPIEVHEVPGGHLDLFEKPNVHMLAEKLKMILMEAQKNR